MITVRIEDFPSLKATIQPKNQVIFAKVGQSDNSLKATITAMDQTLTAKIEQKVEMEPYYEVGNESGGFTIIIGD